MSSLNTKDEQTPKKEKEDGYSIVPDGIFESADADSGMAVDDETGEELYAVEDYSACTDLQSFVLSYLFSFLPSQFTSSNNLNSLDDPTLLIKFNQLEGNKIYEPPEERQELVAFLSFMRNSFATSDQQNDNLRKNLAKGAKEKQAPASMIEKKKNHFFEKLKSELKPTFIKRVKNGNNIDYHWQIMQNTPLASNAFVYSRLLPEIKKAFKHDAQFSKMLEIVEELSTEYLQSPNLNDILAKQKKLKEISDLMNTSKLEEKVENKGNIRTIFFTSSTGEKMFSKLQFKDGLTLAAEDLVKNESSKDCYVFEKTIKNEQTGENIQKKYFYNVATKTLIEQTIGKNDITYINYNGSKIEKYSDGYKTTINGKSFLYCNGGRKLVCIDPKDKQFGFEFTAVDDKRQKKLVKSEPDMTFGYWTTYDQQGNVYKTFGQKKKDSFSYNPAHDAKTGQDCAIVFKNDKRSYIETENKENFIKAKRLIDGLENIRTRTAVKTLYSEASLDNGKEKEYSKFINTYSDFLTHSAEREQMYSRNYDYEKTIDDKLKKEKEKKEKKEA